MNDKGLFDAEKSRMMDVFFVGRVCSFFLDL